MERSKRFLRFGERFTIVFSILGLTACLDKGNSSIEDSLAGNVSTSLTSESDSRTDSSDNRAPTIGGKPTQEISPGTTYFFKPLANDPDGDRLGFSIRNKPAWARFDPNSGTLEGIPSSSDTGLVTGIIISVSDGARGTALAPFSIKITTAPIESSPPPVVAPPVVPDMTPPSVDSGQIDPVTDEAPPVDTNPPVLPENPTPPEPEPTPPSAENLSPEISGTPIALAAVNQLYVFRPLATDPEGDELEYGVVNLPSWLSFDSLSGTVSGIPAVDNVGTYNNIWVSVTDGFNVTALGPFSVEVVTIGRDSVSLSWQPPIENDDGTPLLDLAGYRLRYGLESNTYPNVIDINSPGILTFSVDNLVPNKYYFVLSAYNSNGIESSHSNEASINLN
jgi:hypothetical protein